MSPSGLANWRSSAVNASISSGASFHADVAAGPAIVLCALAAFTVALLATSLRRTRLPAVATAE